MLTLQPDAEVTALLAPVREVLDKAARMLPGGPPVSIRLADIERPYLVGTAQPPEVVLHRGLQRPTDHAPWEPQTGLLPMPRMHRAVACVLEGCALVELARRTEAPPQLDDWRWVGAAVYAANMVAPDLQLAEADLATALAHGDLVAHPRAGVAAYLAWRQAGVDPIGQAQYLIDGGVVSDQEWLRLGRWVFDHRGPMSRLAKPVAPVAPTIPPCSLGPWSWRLLELPAGPRGGQVVVDGPGSVHSPWCVAGVPHRTLAGSTHEGSDVRLAEGGPVGSWTVASALASDQIVGARGIHLSFHADGRLTLKLDDAELGPMASVAVEGEQGPMGTTEGRWAVAGPRRLAFEGLGDAVQPPRTLRFHRGGLNLAAWLSALGTAPWAWKATGDRLVLRGTLGGDPKEELVEIRLRPR